MRLDRVWMYEGRIRNGRISPEFVVHVEDFIQFAQSHPNCVSGGTRIRCPCTRKKCQNKRYEDFDNVRVHLYKDGFVKDYYDWIYHGEHPSCTLPQEDFLHETHDEQDNIMSDENITSYHTMVEDAAGPDFIPNETEEPPNAEARKFYDMMRAADKEIFPGNKRHSQMSAAVRMLEMKCRHHFSESAYNDMSEFIQEVLPDDNSMPKNFYCTKKLVKGLGLPVEVIHCCYYNCMIFWDADIGLNHCKICGEERYKSAPVGSKRKVPRKKMHYFPLTPRLQRLYASRATAGEMRWSGEHEMEGDKMCHPSDSKAWKHFDQCHPQFASEIRNVRLGLCSDGFQPFDMRPSSNAGVTRTRREAAPPPAQLDPPPPQPGDPPPPGDPSPPGDPEPPPSPPLDPHSGRMSLPKCTVSKNGKRLHSGRKVINPSRVMTTILKKTWYKHGHSWRFLSEMEKEVFFEEFKKNFRWTASDDLVRRAFFSHASVRYSNTISDIKKKWFKDKKIDESVGEEVMNEWIKVWSCSDYQKMCQQKRKNRLSEPEPGAGPVTHGCGSKPMTEHQEFLTEKEGKTPTVPALFLYTHTINHDGITFVDNKAADTYARFKEILASRLAVDGSNPTDTEENQIWYELVEGEKKQRVYGVGSSAPSYYSDVARFPDQPTPSQANQDFDNLRRAHEKLQDQFRVLQYQFDVVVDHLRTDCPIPLVFSTPAASSPSRPSDDTVDTTDLDDEF